MSAIKVLFSRQMIIILLLSLVGGSFSLYAEDAPKKGQNYEKEKNAFLDAFKSKELLEKERAEREKRKKLAAQKAAQGSNSAGSGDMLDEDMKDLEDLSKNILKAGSGVSGSIDPHTLKVMQNSLPANLLKNLQRRKGQIDPSEEDEDSLGIDPAGKQKVPQISTADLFKTFRDMSQYQVESYLKLAVQGTSMEKYLLKDFPRIIPYAATVLRHKTALPSFLDMYIEKRKEIFIVVVIFILAGFIGKFMKKFNRPTKSFATVLGRFFMRFTVVWAVRIGAIVALLGQNLKPLFDVTIKFFF